MKKTHLFTTNYDRIIEHVCAASGIEFSDGFIGSQNKLVAPWKPIFNCKICLYKLHGSVSYYVDQKERNRPTFLRLDKGYPLPGPDFRLSREGHDLEPLMVLPTLEKDALGDPYGHLNHIFTQTISDTKLIVAVGTSLRDNHLISAINYNATNIVILIVDTDPSTAKTRIPDVSSVLLRANAREFFENSVERLLTLVKKCSQSTEKQTVLNFVEEFATNESTELSQSLPLTDEQKSALRLLRSSTQNQNYELLIAIQRLRGITDPRIFHAVVNKTDIENSAEVRKAAVACIGLSGNPLAVNELEKIIQTEQSSDIRLEAYLSLVSIGTEAAKNVLEVARQHWPDDTYFQ